MSYSFHLSVIVLTNTLITSFVTGPYLSDACCRLRCLPDTMEHKHDNRFMQIVLLQEDVQISLFNNMHRGAHQNQMS